MLLNGGEYELRPSLAGTTRRAIFAAGRLARLELRNARSPIYFMAKDGSTAAYVGLVYCRDASGNWIVIRQSGATSTGFAASKWSVLR